MPSHGWSQQRRYPRYRTNLLFKVLNYKERDLDGSCLVIAEGGLGGILPEPIPVGSVVQLQLALPSHLTVPLPWAVVRYRVDAHHGFEFVSLTEAEKLSIRQFCSELAILTTKTIAPASGIPGAGPACNRRTRLFCAAPCSSSISLRLYGKVLAPVLRGLDS
jgi:hypothetical protein